MLKLIKRLQEKFNIEEVQQQKNNLTFVTLAAKDLVNFITHLKNIEDFTHLSFLTAVDRIEQDKFQLTYMLHNHKTNYNLAVKAFIERANPVVESIHNLWQQAATYQRELYEMFGIDFPGSPRLKEDFILEDWHDIPPMRRDFKTKEYSEKTYFPRPGRKTHDPEEYMKEKLYPEGDE